MRSHVRLASFAANHPVPAPRPTVADARQPELSAPLLKPGVDLEPLGPTGTRPKPDLVRRAQAAETPSSDWIEPTNAKAGRWDLVHGHTFSVRRADRGRAADGACALKKQRGLKSNLRSLQGACPRSAAGADIRGVQGRLARPGLRSGPGRLSLAKPTPHTGTPAIRKDRGPAVGLGHAPKWPA